MFVGREGDSKNKKIADGARSEEWSKKKNSGTASLKNPVKSGHGEWWRVEGGE
jgi:hypothetical protein